MDYSTECELRDGLGDVGEPLVPRNKVTKEKRDDSGVMVGTDVLCDGLAYRVFQLECFDV